MTEASLAYLSLPVLIGLLLLAVLVASLCLWGGIGVSRRLSTHQRFERLTAHLNLDRLVRSPADWRWILPLAGLLFVSAFVFFAVAEDVLEADPALVADQVTYSHLRALRSPLGDQIMVAITELGDSVVVLGVAASGIGWLLYCRARRTAIFWLIAIAGGSLINTVIKGALHRPRPTDLYHAGWDQFSFPSGHSTTNAVLYGFLLATTLLTLRSRWRLGLIASLGALITLIAFSRLYLGAHWLSDVVGGLAFGTLWVCGLSVIYLCRSEPNLRPVGLIIFSLSALLLVGATNIVFNHARDMERYHIRALDDAR